MGKIRATSKSAARPVASVRSGAGAERDADSTAAARRGRSDAPCPDKGRAPTEARTTHGQAPGASPARRSPARHRALLAAARACVVRDGYAATTIDAIAAEAGSGKQTIYRWWPSKAALFVEVYTAIVSREALVPPASGSATERLAGMLRRLFRLYRETPAGGILAGLIAASTSDPETRDAVAEGLVIGRADLAGEIVEAEHPAGAQAANEIVVAMVWKRLIMEPDSLTDGFADDLARLAVAAARAAAGGAEEA